MRAMRRLSAIEPLKSQVCCATVAVEVRMLLRGVVAASRPRIVIAPGVVGGDREGGGAAWICPIQSGQR